MCELLFVFWLCTADDTGASARHDLYRVLDADLAGVEFQVVDSGGDLNPLARQLDQERQVGIIEAARAARLRRTPMRA